MKLLLLAVTFTAVSGLAVAEETKAQRPAAASEYVIVKQNATMPFARSITGYQVGKDGSLIIQGTGGRWYRATLFQPCRSDLAWKDRIGFDTHPMNQLDKFSTVVVSGRRCSFQTFDEIQNPRDKKPEAKEKT
jgi:hypothetical protein